MEELGLAHSLQFAPYHQVFQAMLDGSGVLAANRSGVNVVLVRLEDWAEAREGAVEQFAALLRAAAPGPEWIVILCPPSPGWLAEGSHADWQSRLERDLAAAMAALPAVHFSTARAILEMYPVSGVHDITAEALGRLPYSQEFFAALGTWIARRIHALRVPPYKVLVLDCDNTLWSGICGEDGPSGVAVEQANRDLQSFALAQRASGMVLALCSKNNEQDVLDTFEAHPEMPLKLDHFAARRINWEAKSANLTEIAGELALGLDSFIFIDDDRRECAEVASDCPGVLSLPFPGNGAETALFLRHVWAFDRARVTEADRERAVQYAQRAERNRAERHAGSLAEFIAGLKLEISIEPPAPEQLARVAQLSQRTNQMNCGAPRRTEAGLRALLAHGAAGCLAVHVADRFGDYGLVGVLIFEASGQALSVDTCLLSCRALGRGVEHAMLARLGREAQRRGLREVRIPFQPTARNEPARAFLESLDGARCDLSGDSPVFVLDSATAAAAHWTPAAAPVAAPRGDEMPAALMRRFDGYARIASELRSVEQVMARLRQRRKTGQLRTVSGPLPRTELEIRIAALWSELLGVEPVGAEENFFDLGGHSLLAIQLLSRIRQEFGADLTIDVVYAGDLTVAELARLVEMNGLDGVSPEEYEVLLREIEALPDEEVRALLEAERRSFPEA